MATTAPPPPGRYRTLDIVRGVAVIGILVINILSFALPQAARLNPLAGGGESVADLLTWAIEWVAFENKMRGLFSVLFGASLLVAADRARASGRGVWRSQLPRLAVLLALGVAHFTLLWDGDILILYAVVALAALPCVRLGADRLRRAMVATFVLGGFLALMVGVAGQSREERAAAERGPATELLMERAELAARRAPYAAQVRARAHSLSARQVGAVGVYGPETLGLMLLGMVLVRSGLLTGEWTRARAGRWAWRLALAGATPLAALAAWLWASGFPPGWIAFHSHALSYPCDIALTVAWAAGLSAWAQGAGGWLSRALEATGRAAFTNYIATSLVMTTVFYGYGGGLFGRVSRAETLAFVALGAALMLAWSRPWLTRFSYGPLEWLWRSLARARLQPMAGGALAR